VRGLRNKEKEVRGKIKIGGFNWSCKGTEVQLVDMAVKALVEYKNTKLSSRHF
jgi:hypothetical protein